MRSEPPFASFWFDCDSTLSAIEGIDVLSAQRSEALRDDVCNLTHEAMEGNIPLADVYERRLAMIAPGVDDLLIAGKTYVDQTVPDVRETIAALTFLDKHVGIVSGGIRQPVVTLAEHLGVPVENVHAVAVLLDNDGNYLGFDRGSPLWRNGGKLEVLRTVPADHRPLLFVGDGATDLEAKEVVDLFVGFGGVARRELVEAGADAFIAENSLAPLLDIGLTKDEKQRLRQEPDFQHLLP